MDSSSEKIGEIINTTRPNAVEIQLKLYEIFMPILGIFIICINLVIVISSGLILRKKQEPRSTYIFLGNLALSDFLIGLSIIFEQAYPNKYMNEIACSVQIGLLVTSVIVSGFSIALIAIDRYLYIIKGIKYKQYFYTNRSRLIILFSWLTGFIIGFLPAFGIRNDTDNGRLCWFVILTPPELICIITAIGIIPLAVVIVLYSIILKKALQKISQNNASRNNGTEVGNLRLFKGKSNRNLSNPENDEILENERKNKLKRNKTVFNSSKWKAIKIVLFTTGCFVITWIPYCIASTMYAFCNRQTSPIFCDRIKVALTSPLAILGLCNSLINPIIYAWWHNGFRQSLKKMWPFKLIKISRQKDSNIELSQQRNSGVTYTVTPSTEIESSSTTYC